MNWEPGVIGFAALAASGFVALGGALRRQSLALVGLGLGAAALLTGLLAGWAPVPVAIGGAVGAVGASELTRWLIDARRRGGRVSIEAIVVGHSARGAVIAAALAAVAALVVTRVPGRALPGLWVAVAVLGVASVTAGAARALGGLGRSSLVASRPARTLAVACLIVVVVPALAALGARARLPGSDASTPGGSGQNSAEARPERPSATVEDPPQEAAETSTPSDSTGLFIATVALALVLLLILGRRTQIIPPEDLVPDRLAPPELPPLGEPAEGPDRIDHGAVVASVDEALVQLRSDVEPRLAVRMAYATVTTGLGRQTFRRERSESEEEYLRRVLSGLGAGAGPLHRLTELFEIARFSEEPVTEEMRGEALVALEAIRGEVRA